MRADRKNDSLSINRAFAAPDGFVIYGGMCSIRDLNFSQRGRFDSEIECCYEIFLGCVCE